MHGLSEVNGAASWDNTPLPQLINSQDRRQVEQSVVKSENRVFQLQSNLFNSGPLVLHIRNLSLLMEEFCGCGARQNCACDGGL